MLLALFRSLRVLSCCAAACLSLTAFSSPAFAQLEPNNDSALSDRPQLTRNAVHLLLRGSAAEEPILISLLRAELQARGLTLIVEQATGSVRDWLGSLKAQKRALLGVVLDTSGSDSWALYLVDVARDQAAARQVMTEGAVVEAVASIVVSAADAVGRGQGVGQDRPADVLARVAEQPQKPAAAPANPGTSPGPPPPSPRYDSDIHDFSGTATTLDAWGLGLAGVANRVGKMWLFAPRLEGFIAFRTGVQLWNFGVFAEWGAARQVQTPVGDFRLQRSLLALGLGPSWRIAQARLMVLLGTGVEVYRRTAATPIEDAQAAPSASHARLSASAALGGSYPLGAGWAISGMLSFGFSPAELSYISSNGDQLLSVPGPSISGQLGLRWWSSDANE